MFTFDTAVDLQRKFVEFYTAGKVAAAWRIEDALRERGANFIQAVMWRKFAVRDGNLVTGQQNFSGSETARLVIETLGR